MNRIYFLVMAILLVGSTSQAGLLIEPHLGYEFTQHKETLVATGDAGGNLTGLDYGLRLGYKMPVLLWFALEGNFATGKLKYSNSASYLDDDTTRTVMGATVGVDLPLFLRIWAGYGFSDQMTLKNTTRKDTLKGTNTKVGVGFKAIPLLSLNVEYIMRKYTDASGDSFPTGTNFSSVITKAEENTVLVSVSIPLNL